jgi:hypothetical protein
VKQFGACMFGVFGMYSDVIDLVQVILSLGSWLSAFLVIVCFYAGLLDLCKAENVVES